MADQVTPDKTPEEIEREMLCTRESITEKVAALENQVVGTVQNVTETINGTVDAVKSFVSAAPETVSDTMKQATAAVSNAVKDTFDITGHVRRHPWGALGVSALLGCVAGWLISRDRTTPVVASGLAVAPPTPPAPPHADTTPGMFDEILGMVGAKVKELATTTLETATATLKENIQTGMSRLVDSTAPDWSLTCNPRSETPSREGAPVRL